MTTEEQQAEHYHLPTGTRQLDHVLSGGLVETALILLGGVSPSGKTTLCLQVACMLSDDRCGGDGPLRVLYVSTDEEVSALRKIMEPICDVESPPIRHSEKQRLRLIHEKDMDKVKQEIEKFDPELLVFDQLPERQGAVDAMVGLISLTRKRSMMTIVVARHDKPTLPLELADIVVTLSLVKQPLLRAVTEGLVPTHRITLVKNLLGCTTEPLEGLLTLTPEGFVSADGEGPSITGPSTDHRDIQKDDFS